MPNSSSSPSNEPPRVLEESRLWVFKSLSDTTKAPTPFTQWTTETRCARMGACLGRQT